MTFAVSPIGIVRSDRAEVVDDNWGSVQSVIELDRTVLDAYEGGLPSARYLGVMAEAAEIAGAPAEYVRDLRTRNSRNVGPGTAS